MRLERRRAVAATPGLESWPGDFPAPDSGALALSWSREAWSMGRRGQRSEIRRLAAAGSAGDAPSVI
jgi:hypothetical protein